MISNKELLEQQALVLQELLRRKNLPIYKYTPTNELEHNQLSFHESTKRWRILTGGNRSGKSIAAAAEIAMYALNQHRFKKIENKPRVIWCVSSEYRNLYNGLWRHLRPDAQDQPGGGAGFLIEERVRRIGPKLPNLDIPSYIEVYSDNTKEKFSRIEFMSAEGGESARKRMQSAEVDLVAIDEEIDEQVYNEILMRILSSNGEIMISATLLRSEEWLLNLEDKAQEKDSNILHVRLNTEENKYIDRQALEDLTKDLSDEDKAIRIRGESRRNFGLIYNTFDHKSVIDPIIVKDEWKRFCAIDPGLRVCAVLWMAVDEINDLFYIYRELYLKETDLSQVVAEINSAERWYFENGKRYPKEGAEIIEQRLIDPSAIRKFEDGSPGIAYQLITDHDIHVLPADNEEMGGIEACRRLLTLNKLRVFSTCHNFLKERRSYKIDRKTGKAIRRNNHLMDCWKYLSLYLTRLYGYDLGGKTIDKQIDDADRKLYTLFRDKKYEDKFLGVD